MVKTSKRRRYRRIRPGQKIGRWTVTSTRRVIRRNTHWWCRCVCGVEKFVKQQYLKEGCSTQCVACGQRPKGYTEVLPRAVWRVVLRRAERHGRCVRISRVHAEKILVAQDFKCALTALPINIRRNGTATGVREATASLDRIDSRVGYVKGNVQWVHKHINVMKNVYSQKYFVEMCRAVADTSRR